MKIKTIIQLSLLLAFFAFCFWYVARDNSSVVINVSEDNPVSLFDLRDDYLTLGDTSNEKIDILIAPGHEPNNGGAKFKDFYERDLVAEIGQDLQTFLQKNPKYNVNITRSSEAWNPVFSNYFDIHWSDIIAWEKTSKKNASNLISLGSSSSQTVIHNTAPADVALRLYGITKWANENNIDLMIHLHLNDYPGHSIKVPGKYSGLVIYTPAAQYNNSSTTKAVANSIFRRLALYNPVSNLRVESRGIVDDQELIAVGANNTSDAASLLIEYDYIYESQFVNSKVRSLALKDLAYQTYLGIQDFFTRNNNVTTTSSYHPSSFYVWNTQVKDINSNPEDIYAMQTALIMDGDYPPVGKSKNECPHSGAIGSCTKIAVQSFQNKYGITGESIYGQKTFNLLNDIYSKQNN